MLQTALSFLDGHKEITLATCEGNLPKLRVFQVMKREGNMLYFATSPEKAVWRELQQNSNVELLAANKDAAAFTEALKAAYPELPGDADALAQALYKK